MTAEEFLNSKYPDLESLKHGNIWVNVENLMIDFAQHHVEQALQEVSDKVLLRVIPYNEEEYLNTSVKSSYLNENHIDGDKLNNRLENLELITQSENVRKGDKCKKAVSKYIGVTWYKQYQKWRANIYKNKKHHHIGYYETEKEAFDAIITWNGI